MARAPVGIGPIMNIAFTDHSLYTSQPIMFAFNRPHLTVNLDHLSDLPIACSNLSPLRPQL